MSFNESDLTNYRTFLVDDRAKLIYCLAGNTGTTTLTSLMRKKYDDKPVRPSLANHRHYLANIGLYYLSSVKNATERRSKLDEYRTFLVARNPYVRLYSGYLQKSHQFEKMIDDDHLIQQEFPDMHNTRNVPMTFEMFLQMITLSMNSTIEPLKSTKLAAWKSDPHFASVWDLCHPCHVRYDYIFKTESLCNDSNLFLPLFNETSMVHHNAASSADKPLVGENLRTVKILDPKTAIRQVSKPIMKGIGILFRRDLEVFGYGLYSDKMPY